MASVTVGESQLQRIIRDLQDAVSELSQEHQELGEPVTDDSSSLHKFCYKLEYLLQFDQKEKKTLLGNKKDYWDYFYDCLGSVKGANDGIRYVKSIPELKTSLGRGRAFIRYSLVHQRLADTLQQCLMNQRVTSDWYYARSPFLKSHLNVDIVNHLYELNEVQFDVASRGYDLDASWPSFARRTLGSPANFWRTPSRSSSVGSLVSSCLQQTPELPCSPEFEPGAPGGTVEELRLELDRSELRQRELLERVGRLSEEATGLRDQVRSLEEQLERRCQQPQRGEVAGQDIEARLSGAERMNAELLSRLDAALFKKGQQVAVQLDSAQKIHALLDKLSEVEKERLEAQREAEEGRREVARLGEELRQKETAGPGEEHPTMLRQVAELQGANDKLRGNLVVKEKEASNLQRQMLDLQGELEESKRQALEEKRRMQQEKEGLEERHCGLRVALECQLRALTEQLEAKERDLSSSTEKTRLLERQVDKLVAEKQGLSVRLAAVEVSMKDQERKTEEYKGQCNSLMELNGKLLESVRRSEEAKRELAQARAGLQGELSSLHAFKTKSQHQSDEAMDGVAKSCLSATEETEEARVQRLEQENRELREEQAAVKEALSSTQEELHCIGSHISELEKSLAASRRSESCLQEQLREKSDLLGEEKKLSKELKTRLEVLEERASAEKTSSRLALESQIELHVKEVSRLQAEAVDLRCEVQGLANEKLKVQAKLEVAEASCEEMKALAEQLKAQVEELNRRHVQEMLCHQQREEALDRELEARGIESASSREELMALRCRHERLVLEHGEMTESLRRASTERAELGVQLCRLTSDIEEASARLRALEKENSGLRAELQGLAGLPGAVRELQERLEQADARAKGIQESARDEVDAVRVQLSSEAGEHQAELKVVREELASVTAQLMTEREKMSSLEAEVSQLKAENSGYSQRIEEKSVLIERSESVIRQKDADIIRLSEDLTRSEGELAAVRVSCCDLKEQLDRMVAERHNSEMKTSAEIDDLYRTKKNLEERLIELIRDKDALWQKSDALEFQQKLQSEDVADRDGSQCMSCQSQFSWWVRRHPCRLCSRTLCYQCSNSTTRTLPNGKRERCCRECGLAQERPQEAGGGNPCVPASPSRATSLHKHSWPAFLTEEVPRPDDGVFDIITEDELNGVYDSDSMSHTNGGSPERLRGSPKHRALELNSSSGHSAFDDSDELSPIVQDAEIYLLKSGELTLSAPLSLEDIACFGQASRELFVKSSCYSTIPIVIPEVGLIIIWTFSSEPKSISFSMVYREAQDTPVEQSKVLIPLTRCNSHKETIQGQVKVRNPGIYTLVFDNSFSRFISKKVLYHLTIQKPLSCDESGSS